MLQIKLNIFSKKKDIKKKKRKLKVHTNSAQFIAPL